MGRKKGKTVQEMNIQTTDGNIKDELVIDSDTENDPPMNPSSTPTLDMSVESSSDTDDRNDYEMPNKNLLTGVLPFKGVFIPKLILQYFFLLSLYILSIFDNI